MTRSPGRDTPVSDDPPVTSSGASYAAAGVDIKAGERAVELMRSAVAETARLEVRGGIGGFAGLFDATALTRYRQPLLATSTDGVGTKVAIAAALGSYDTVGQDLVGMVVDDLVVCGAEPLFLTDYLATGKVVPERVARIVAGVAAGCVRAGCALLGGETAEHPGLLGPDEFDLAGAATGVVEAADLLGPDRVVAGDVVVAIASSGLHSNGYSLVRHVLLDPSAGAGWALERDVPELGRALGQELLEPTLIYASDCLALIRAAPVHAMAHVTGGGLAANLARSLPAGVHAVIDRGSWSLPPVFALIADVGKVGLPELERTLNVGVGMAVVLPADAATAAVNLLADRGLRAWMAGTLKPDREPSPGSRSGTAELVGRYA